MWPETLNIDVSRETIEKLKIYHELLLKWQKAINLVSPKTIDEAWVRHFADSVQIEHYVSRESQTVVDLGSGAGFPGLVLAIMRPDLEVHMIESDDRKCQFLRTVSRETNVDVMVHNSRIEDVQDAFEPDLVTARALADLSLLLEYAEPWAIGNSDLECLFLKGVRVDEEISRAGVSFSFEAAQFPSITDSQARILHLRNISRKNSA